MRMSDWSSDVCSSDLAGAAVVGYFPGKSFALPVDARSPTSIASAMRLAMDNELTMKAELAEWQRIDDALRFMRPAIAEAYSRRLRAALRERYAQHGTGGRHGCAIDRPLHRSRNYPIRRKRKSTHLN